MNDTLAPVAPEVPASAPIEQPDDYKAFRAEKLGSPAPEAAAPPTADPPPAPAGEEQPPAPPVRPWHAQNQIPPERLQIRLEKTQAELEELRRQVAPQVPQAPAVDQGPQKPKQEDFIKDGQFDSAGYLDAFGAWTRAETIKEIRADQAKQSEQAAAQTAEQEARTAVQTFEQKVQEFAAVDPDIAAGVAHFRQNYGRQVPEVVARELVHGDPRIMYAIACSEDLTAQVTRGDIAQTLKVIGILEDRIAAHDRSAKAQPPAPPAGAYVPRGGAPQAPANPAPPAPRNEAGQFAARPPVPAEYGAAAGGGSNPLLADDYDTFKKARKAS